MYAEREILVFVYVMKYFYTVDNPKDKGLGLLELGAPSVNTGESAGGGPNNCFYTNLIYRVTSIVYSNVHYTSLFRKTRKTRPCLTGHPIVYTIRSLIFTYTNILIG